MKNILYINDVGKIGGAEKILYNLLSNLDRSRYHAMVLFGSDGPLVKMVSALGIETNIIQMKEMKRIEMEIKGLKFYNPLAIIYNVLQFLILIFKLFIFLRKRDIDLVHTNTIQAQLCGSIVAKLIGAKLVCHDHNIQPQGMRRRIISIIGNIFPDGIITVSNAVRNSYLPYILHPEKITTVHNGIDVGKMNLSHKCVDIRKEYEIPEEAIIIAMASVLRPWKGHETFLRAASIIKRNCRDVRFLIVGGEFLDKERGYKDYLVNLGSQLGLEDRVIFTGFRRDVIDILSQVDLLVSASILPDPFPTVILEAMALGIPVVATHVGGVPEMVMEGVTGYLLPPSDPPEMAEKIMLLLKNPIKRKEMGSMAQQSVKDRFTMDKFISGIESIYGNLL